MFSARTIFVPPPKEKEKAGQKRQRAHDENLPPAKRQKFEFQIGEVICEVDHFPKNEKDVLDLGNKLCDEALKVVEETCIYKKKEAVKKLEAAQKLFSEVKKRTEPGTVFRQWSQSELNGLEEKFGKNLWKIR